MKRRRRLYAGWARGTRVSVRRLGAGYRVDVECKVPGARLAIPCYSVHRTEARADQAARRLVRLLRREAEIAPA